MRKFILAIAILFSTPAMAQFPPIQMPNNFNLAPVALDQYGGRMDISCTNATGHFTLVKIVNRWFFCTPAGHAYVSMNATTIAEWGGQCAGTSISSLTASRYGSSGPYWSDAAFKRLFSWGFNGVGVDSADTDVNRAQGGIGWPNNVQPIKVPYMYEIKPASGAMSNYEGGLTSALKDIQTGLDTSIYTKYGGDADFDFFESSLLTGEISTELSDGFTASQIVGVQPYLLTVVTDDSDFFFGSGVSPDLGSASNLFSNVAGNPDIGWMTLIASPVQVSGTAKNTLVTFLYSDQNVLAKNQALNPVTACSITNPCSLRDYLWQEYGGSIASLNTAWTSNYSTFDSSGVQFTKETIATGNGATATYTYTPLHTPASPKSVAIYYTVGANSYLIGGDIPKFTKYSPTGLATNTGGFLGPPKWAWGTTPNTAPLNWLITDSNGCIEQATVSGTKASTQPTWAAGTACTPGTTTTDNKATWTCVGPGLTLGTTSTVNYTTSALSLTFVQNVPSGAVVSVSYIQCGWHTSCGTGLMDEWGKSVAAEPTSGPCTSLDSSCWVGSNNVCLVPTPAAYQQWSSCKAGLDGAPNANSTVGTDVENWIPEYAAEYFKTVRAALQAGNVQSPYGGIDLVGSNGITGKGVWIQGEAPYVDLLFAIAPSGAMNQQNPMVNGANQEAYLQAKYNYLTQYAGDIPVGFQYQSNDADFDSGMYCSTAVYNYTTFNKSFTQTQRGMDYYRDVNWLMRQPSFNGDYQTVLVNFWVFQDFQGLNQGLVSPADNAYDGVETSNTAVPCQGYTAANGTNCGGEATMPKKPTLSTASGSCPTASNFIETTYVTANGQTLPSQNNSVATASNCAVVTSPQPVVGATGYNVYANTVSSTGTYTLQNVSPIALQSSWTEPAGGITTNGATAPITDASGLGSYGDMIDYVKAANFIWLFGIQSNSAKAASPRVAIP